MCHEIGVLSLFNNSFISYNNHITVADYRHTYTKEEENYGKTRQA